MMEKLLHSAKLLWTTPKGEDLIAYQARVSNPANQNKEPAGLISYLVREKHWSPFEMVNLCFEVNTTRAVGRQLLRHSPRIQEFSQRYADPSVLGSFVTTPARMQHPTNRQMSEPNDDEALDAWWLLRQTNLALEAEALYSEAVANGIAKEVARIVLPEGMTKTSMYMNANLRDWLFLTNTRIGHGTQPETESIALQIKEVIEAHYPHTAKAFYENN